MVIINQTRRNEGKVVQLGKYELGKTLGEGNFGKVKLARGTDCGQFFAVKIHPFTNIKSNLYN
ncbi:CBL-interacting kinase, putative [Medicago truncatula]|uniref:CBL-interacting kinase, putative n=1 Tax=Medicago truncatula TaxID=3880 RepID=A0A072U4Y1_MEDTR|nr:CBL-interacting kinase, putative [Medicago truncatula]